MTEQLDKVVEVLHQLGLPSPKELIGRSFVFVPMLLNDHPHGVGGKVLGFMIRSVVVESEHCYYEVYLKVDTIIPPGLEDDVIKTGLNQFDIFIVVAKGVNPVMLINGGHGPEVSGELFLL